jgi:hypothetical protein
MKLIPAGGSPRMQRALVHSYVRTVVTIIRQDLKFLRDVALILKCYQQRAQPGLQEELDALCVTYRVVDEAGQVETPEHVMRLAEALHNLYQQNREDIQYQRGAILELLTYELVRPRYNDGECVHNHRFIDGKYASDQIDVAVLAPGLRYIEGYECKLKIDSIESSDCTNLVCLEEVATQCEYCVHVGIVALDETKYMQRRLQRLCFSSPSLHIYGLNTIEKLQTSPFILVAEETVAEAIQAACKDIC